ncbi:unnamed protein product [Cuscuta epithymum]|uniref:Uncharacterized protein n=1 Tax=Cuscuta epithymum TaxID=186058 RepID=A0AAV0F4N7_9ASTE|nr:unnamed protein product [Cuscuta epithymum]
MCTSCGKSNYTTYEFKPPIRSLQEPGNESQGSGNSHIARKGMSKINPDGWSLVYTKVVHNSLPQTTHLRTYNLFALDRHVYNFCVHQTFFKSRFGLQCDCL